MSDLFGQIITGNDVEAAATATLKTWLPTYLAEMERLTGRTPGTLQTPRSWATSSEFTQEMIGALPAAIVVSPGTVGDPEQRGDSSYDALFDVRVAIIVAGSTRAASNELAKLYAAAVRALMLQHPSLAGDALTGGIATDVEWLGEANGALPTDYLASGWATESAFSILVPGVVTALAGPATPDLTPGVIPTVETAETDVERKDIP